MSEDGIERDGIRKGDLVVVTGGGGGFGRAFAKRFAAGGARVAVWENDRKTGAETVRQVTEAGGEARLFEVDLASPAAIAEAAERTLAAYGTPYCVINNAGVFPRGEVLDLSLEAWETTLRVNLTAPFLVVKAFGPSMIAARRGVVINIASGRAVEGTANGANYACSKAAILSFTKSLALEWARHGIRVNAIIPGQSLTAMPLAAAPAEELHARARAHVPLGRIGYPEDMAGLAAFLASADGAYMTGQGVAMNGGAVMVP